MKVKLQVRRDGAAQYEGIYDVSDAASFGKACTNLWNQLRGQKLASATSIGALYDELDDRLLEELYGAEISFSKA